MNNPLSIGIKQMVKEILKLEFPYATFKLTLKTGGIHDILFVKVDGDADLAKLEEMLITNQTNYCQIVLTGKTYKFVA